MASTIRPFLKSALLLLLLGASAGARAATDWSAQDYDLYPGDFNGDGLTDVLYVAKDPSHPSGIMLSDGSGLNTPLQSWGDAYLGVPWSAGLYNILVGDFNGDGKADIFLQRKTPGDHYLLLTETGGVGAISQTVANTTAGLSWSGDQHKLVVGDFNGDGQSDLFFQALDSSGLNAVMLADAAGQFTATAPAQSWNDGYAGFGWALTEANVYAGDFNGDGLSDLLVQAQPTVAATATDPAVFVPNSNGVVLAQPAPAMFVTANVQAWNRDGFNVNWSPLSQQVVVGDFNGDGRSDVLLQALTSSDTTYLVYGSAPGPAFASPTTLSSSVAPSADGFRVLVGDFTSAKGQGVYLQALTPGGTSYLGSLTGSTLSLVAQSQSLSASAMMADAPAATDGAVTDTLAAAALAVTSAGRTPGQFAVSAMGAATYQIPIWTPPGARGVEPKLALAYASGSPDGMMGPGWNLSGLSSIARCNKTYADNAGAPARVTLTTADNFCIDGNRMRVTSGTYGAAGSVYQTQIANFSRITANGTAGNGPSYFVVEGKDGLIYEYGNTADSKAYANGGTTPYAWMLNKVRDRQTQADNMIITYSTTSGAVQPASIQYTQTPSTANGTIYPYTVSFTYQNRLTNLSKYVAGQNIQQTQVLSKINVQSSGTSVRQYLMTYQTAPTTQRDRLSGVQECAGSLGTDCLKSTTVTYQNGAAGVSTTATSLPFPAGIGGTVYYDFNGDGKPDLLYYNAGTYYVMLSTASGYDSAISTGVTAPIAYGDIQGLGKDGIVANNAGNLWYYTYNGTAFVGVSLGLAVPTGISPVLVDTEGNGRPNYIIWQGSTIVLYRNTSTTAAPSFSATPITALTFSQGGLSSGLIAGSHSIRSVDFDGDGRKDLMARKTYRCGPPGEPDVCSDETELLSAGTTLTAGPVFTDNGLPVSGFANWNADACTDLILGDASVWATVHLSPCNGSTPVDITIQDFINVIDVMDWDGDGQSDIVYVSGTAGTLSVYRSTGTGASAAIATSVPYAAGNTYTMIDVDGDGLADIVSANTTGASYFPHSGAGTPADLATTIADGWGMSASPAYVSLSLNNYTKGTAASYPEADISLPIYVVKQVDQSDGIGGTYRNSFWYYGARVNWQGRGFEGFAETRSQDDRNSIYQYVYYNQAFPYSGTVSKRETYQPNGTSLISRTVNAFNFLDLAGAGCAATTTSASTRCFPYLSTATATNYEISTGSPLVQTSVSTFTFNTDGNPLTAQTATTDNDSASPNYNGVWTSLITNTYNTTSATTWCFDKPTRTTTQNTITGQSPLTRTVDHVVDTTYCRSTSETVEPTSTTLKAVTNYGYDSCGNVNSVGIVGLDKNGATMPTRTTTSGYGARCTFPETVTNALSQTSTTVYNYSYGAKSSTTDPNGVAVSWLYDNFGRKTQENRPDSTYSTWLYEDCTTATCWTIADNLRLRVTETRYDSAGAYVTSALRHYDGFERLKYESGYRILGTLTWTKTTFDDLGRKVDTYLPYQSAHNGYHHLTYDLLNRPTRDDLYNSSGAVDRFTQVGYAGLKTTLTDARLNSTTKWTDVSGKLRQIIDPAPGGTTNYTYDVWGNLTKIYDATTPTTGTPTSSYTYNIRGFKTSSSDQDTGSWTYTPDSLNELVSQQDAKAQVTSIGYDALGRMTSRLEPESATATTWTYGTSAALHEIGRLKSVSKPDGYAESYTFDSLGRPSVTTITEDTSYAIDYAYNTLGAVDTVTYPASTGTRFALKYLYSYGAVQQVKDNAAGTVFWGESAVNDSALPTTEVLGNGITVTSTYKPWTNELLTRKEGTPSVLNSLQDLAYQWDPNGNLSQRQDLKQNLTEAFQHDALNRLWTSTLNGVNNLTVGYDQAGNITSKSDVGTYDYTTQQGACSYTGLTAQPHAVRNAGGAVYCYDKNGNVTSRGGGALAWMSYNLPSSIVYGANSTTFNYNSSHQRWKQDANYAGTHEVTYYIGGLMEKVTKGTGPTEYRHLIPAGSNSAILTRRSDSTTSTYYTTSDHLGSGDLILSNTGTALAKESFTPFGARRGSNWTGIPTTADYTTFSNTTRRGFTGHEMLDSVSLIHMNGRVYDPTIGRFLSADPIIQTTQISQAINPFSYVMNMPLTLTDPSGMSWLSKLFHSIGNFLKKWGAVIISVVFTVIGMPFIGALLSSAFNVAVNGGTLGSFLTGLVIGAVAGAIAGPIGGKIAGFFGAAGEGLGARIVAGAITGAIAGGIGSAASGGSFWSGFAVGAIAGGLTAGLQAKYGSTPAEGTDAAKLEKLVAHAWQWVTGLPKRLLMSSSNQAGERVQGEDVDVSKNQSESGATNVAYRGEFHDQLVKAMTMALRAAGLIVENEITLCLMGGAPVCTRADIVVQTPIDDALSVIEVKTGASPSFTPNQAIVYPHLSEGGLVYSISPRIATFGLSPGVPLPPTQGFLYYQPTSTSVGVPIPF